MSSASQTSAKSAFGEILDKAGEAYTLNQAAAELGIDRVDLYNMIAADRAVGVMISEKNLVVPGIQIVETNSGKEILRGVPEILAQFNNESSAGTWSALQFLVEQDPVLGKAPVDVLKSSDENAVARVVQAARAYLDLY